MQYKELAIDGLWRNNPALVQLLGLCPLLAVSNTFANSLGLGIATLVVLTLSNVVISLLRRLLDDSTRLPAQILVIATFVTLAEIILQAYFFDLYQRIGCADRYQLQPAGARGNLCATQPGTVRFR